MKCSRNVDQYFFLNNCKFHEEQKTFKNPYVTSKFERYLRPEYTNVLMAADADCTLKTSPQKPAGIDPGIIIAPSHALAALKFYKKDRKLLLFM